jgi:hypothetical protein
MPAMVTWANLSASTRHCWLQLDIESLPRPPVYLWWEDQASQMREMTNVLRNREADYLQEA